MRKITELACKAFIEGKPFSLDNTGVRVNDGIAVLSLHGNCIAIKEVNKTDFNINNARWFSKTTKERLNGLPGVSINQKKGKWFLNGIEWNGEVTTICGVNHA